MRHEYVTVWRSAWDGTVRCWRRPAVLKGLGAVPQTPADTHKDSRSTGWRLCVLPSNSGPNPLGPSRCAGRGAIHNDRGLK
jgi:hypothetical protein